MDSEIIQGELPLDVDKAVVEPVLEVFENQSEVVIPASEIVPDAFEQVMAKYDGHGEKSPTEPVYANRLVIAAVCLLGGALVGRFTNEPQTITRIIEKEVPVAAKAKTDETVPPALKSPFRDLMNGKEFDPWKPLNGGFPVPNKETQATLVSNGNNRNSYGGGNPGRMSGDIGMPVVPLDPGGSLPEITGQAGLPIPGADPSTNPGNVGANEVPPVVAEVKGHYISASASGDPESMKGKMAALASSLGGSLRDFVHMSEEGAVESYGILLVVPADKFEKAKAGLSGLSIDSEHEGPASSFQNQIQAMFVTRLAKLREKKKDLLVDFQADAQPVKVMEEAIDKEVRAVAATRVPGGKIAVIRVIIR